MDVMRRVRVTGRVQGVFYRASCQSEAEARGLSGWVRNLDDGSVEALLVGDADAVESMIEWCRSGPELARVDRVEALPVSEGDIAEPERVRSGAGFEVR